MSIRVTRRVASRLPPSGLKRLERALVIEIPRERHDRNGIRRREPSLRGSRSAENQTESSIPLTLWILRCVGIAQDEVFGTHNRSKSSRGNPRVRRHRILQRTNRRAKWEDSYDHAALLRIPQRNQPHRTYLPLLLRNHTAAHAPMTFSLPLNLPESQFSCGKGTWNRRARQVR